MSTSGNDSADGLSWQTAKLSIYTALNVATAGDEVWVTAGDYAGGFTLPRGIKLYGGFNGGEDDLNKRPSPLALTRISNESGRAVTIAADADEHTRLDGFVIHQSKGGVECLGGSPVIANNRIKYNSASSLNGGGICCEGGSPSILNNYIAYNKASPWTIYHPGPDWHSGRYSGGNGEGGGIYCANTSPYICDNILEGNIAYRVACLYMYEGMYVFYGGRGDGIYCINGSPVIENNIVRNHDYVYDEVSREEEYGDGIELESVAIGARVVGNKVESNTGIGIKGGGAVVERNYCADNRCGILGGEILNNQLLNNEYGICYGKAIGNLIIGGMDGFRYGSGSNNTIVGCSRYGIYAEPSKTFTSNIIASCGTAVIYSTDGQTNPKPATFRSNCLFNNTQNYVNCSPDPSDIFADPLFVDAANGDYHLLPASPCIDAGVDFGDLPAFDFDGQGRVYNGLPDIGADEYWVQKLAELKSAKDGAYATVPGTVVTATFSDFFYVEDDNRISGIRVEEQGHSVQVDNRVDLFGSLSTNSHGELFFDANQVSINGSGHIKPLGVLNRSLGSGFGLSARGLLVTTAGSVVSSDATAGFFTISDGSGGVVKCVAPSGVSIDPNWSFVTVTGVASCEKVGDELHRTILIRSQSDIVAY